MTSTYVIRVELPSRMGSRRCSYTIRDATRILTSIGMDVSRVGQPGELGSGLLQAVLEVVGQDRAFEERKKVEKTLRRIDSAICYRISVSQKI